MKKLLIAVAVLVAIVAVAGYFLASNLDKIVKSAIEDIGSESLGVDVRVGAVALSLADGRGTISGLEVDNPPGFSRRLAMSFGEMTLDLGGESGTIDLIRIAESTILVESKAETNNFRELLGGLPEPTVPPEESSVKDDSGEPFVLSIRRIEIDEARAIVTSDEREEPIELTVDSLVFTDLEGTSEQIASQMMRQLLGHIVNETKAAALRAVGEAVEVAVEEAKEGLEEAIREKLEESGDPD